MSRSLGVWHIHGSQDPLNVTGADKIKTIRTLPTRNRAIKLFNLTVNTTSGDTLFKVTAHQTLNVSQSITTAFTTAPL